MHIVCPDVLGTAGETFEGTWVGFIEWDIVLTVYLFIYLFIYLHIYLHLS